MENLAQERISLINSLHSGIDWKGKSHAYKVRHLFWMGKVKFAVSLLLLLFLAFISLSTILELGMYQWEKTGLLVLVSISFFIAAPLHYMDYLLQKNLPLLERSSTASTQDLKQTIASLNNKKKRLLAEIPSLVLFAGALLHFLELNPYWHLFQYLTLTYCFYFAVRTTLSIKAIHRLLGENHTW